MKQLVLSENQEGGSVPLKQEVGKTSNTLVQDLEDLWKNGQTVCLLVTFDSSPGFVLPSFVNLGNTFKTSSLINSYDWGSNIHNAETVTRRHFIQGSCYCCC